MYIRDKGDEARSLGKFTMCETGRVRLLKRGKLYLQPCRIKWGVFLSFGAWLVKTRDCDSRLLTPAFCFD